MRSVKPCQSASTQPLEALGTTPAALGDTRRRPFSVDKGASICNLSKKARGIRELASAPMEHDVELIRALLFSLEMSQTSPRATVIISTDAEADELGCSPGEVETILTTLLDFDYIDGPGHDEPGIFLFRKLTRKGIRFVEATRRERDWERLKRRFASRAPRSIADLP